MRRLHEFLKHGDILYSANLSLRKTHRGVGGRKVHDIISKDRESIFALGPDGVVVMIGKNDTVPGTDPALLAAEIETVVSVIHHRYNVAKIIL